jgi:hypothetical protein
MLENLGVVRDQVGVILSPVFLPERQLGMKVDCNDGQHGRKSRLKCVIDTAISATVNVALHTQISHLCPDPLYDLKLPSPSTRPLFFDSDSMF